MSYRNGLKRLADLTAVLVALPIALPLIAIAAASVLVALGRPILFRQRRVGRDAAPFNLYKFRTMSDARDEHGAPLPDDQRMGVFGRTLRRYSLDELPQLWNVVRGDMSLVGPRPLLEDYLPLYTEEQARRHEVRPGITGWAQVNGRNAIDWETKFSLDVWYVDRVSALLDLDILCRTAVLVVRRHGISSEGHATAPRFEGTGRSRPAPTAPEESCDAIAVLGSGGHAKVAADAWLASGGKILAFFDDNPCRWGNSFISLPVLGPIEQVAEHPTRPALIAIGDNKARRRLAADLPNPWVTAIHPSAFVHDSARLDGGALVCAGAVIQPDVRIGSHCIINTGATVDHDTHIGDFVHIGPGANVAGNALIGNGVLLGIGSTVLPGIKIGQNSIVGAGAVVTRDLPGDCVAVGIPARLTRPDLAHPSQRSDAA